MIQPWTIAVISTDYDLKDERKASIEILREHGIRVSAFEDAEFPVFQNTHSHDNCLLALKRADIAILLINRRYGGKYYLSKDVSITEKEYESLTIPVVVLVNVNVWTERAEYREQVKKSHLSEKEFDSTNLFHPKYVENIEVFHFIDHVQEAYDLDGRSNWIKFWEDLDDLKAKIPLTLQALSVPLIQEFRERQKKEVKSKKTSTAFSMSLGDVIDRKYYIEPELLVESGTISPVGTSSEQINRIILSGESCMVLADAGVGKTTFMAKCFLEMLENVNNPYAMPAYICLKDKGINYSFSVHDYIKDCFERYYHKEYYPFFSETDIHFSFFLDGFDELSEKLTKNELHNLYESEIFQYPIMLTSRIQYAERFLTSNEFASKFFCRILLKEWSEETAKRYIERFCNLQCKDDNFKSRIEDFLTNNTDMKDVIKSPLLVTVLLYVIERNRIEISGTVASRASLLEKCLELLAQREIDTKLTNKTSIPDNLNLVLCWAYFAWYIYEKKLLGGEDGVLISDVEDRIKQLLKLDESNSWPSSVYDAIFDTNDNKAFSTFHEQFLEYLVALALSHSCLNKIEPYPDFLKYVMRPEINHYFQGIVKERPKKERDCIFNNIYQLFMKCAGSTEKEDIAKRVHAVYHLSRLQTQKEVDLIERIFNIEKEHVVLQSLYFGMIKRGDMNREQELYNLLINDEIYSNANRGYHLAYYDALPGQTGIPYSDDIKCNWNGTLKAFQRHFESSDKEHYYLRRIDLLTMRQLMEFRKSASSLTEETLKMFEYYVFHPNYNDDSFQVKIENEFYLVKRTCEKLWKKDEHNMNYSKI